MTYVGPLDKWSKFKLLFWKNWMIMWNHKWALVFQILIPLISLILAVLLLHQTAKPITTNELHFPALDLTKLTLETQSKTDTSIAKNRNPPLPELLYSPNTASAIEMIVKNAAESLGLSYKGYENSEQLTSALRSGNFLAGVKFNDVQDYPTKLSFDIRFPSSLRTSGNKDTWMTTRLFPVLLYSGPRNADEADGGHPVGYYREGFLPIQHAISMAYLKLASQQDSLPEVQFQRFPYPPWVKGHFVQESGMLLTTITLISFMYPCICITKYITSEKENQLKEIIKILGLQNWIHWAAWFAEAFMFLTVSVLLITIILKIAWNVNGSVLNQCSSTVLFFFLSVYVVNSICLCFMIAAFFDESNTAAAAFGFIWLMAYMPYYILARSPAHFLLWCLVSNTAMGFGFTVIVGYEKSGEGSQWSNIFTPVSLDESMTLGTIMLTMLASSALYLLVCLYVEQVFPGKFGERRKWYFPLIALSLFKKKEKPLEMVMRIEKYISSDLIRRNKEPRQSSNTFEAEPTDKTVGIKVKNLEKRFGNKRAVRNLSINIYQDEITVLLGHHGAGKTTMVSMLTGMLPQTSGTAFVNSYEILGHKEGARMSVGICPNHNVLFNDLSAVSNIEFFSRLKGLKGTAIEKEVRKYLMMTDLKNEPLAASSHLSVGMKRMLAVCCTLCGDSKVVIFDEPSSRMNSMERRQLWDLLQAEKAGRTVLLTTHLMHEADMLADRIAIMCNGDLVCYGTSFFLKKKYGYGYLLTCVKDENCSIDHVTALLRHYIPGLRLAKNIGAEFCYELSAKFLAVFEKMLEDLEDNSERLKLKGFGISINSMSDVFSQVGAEKLKRASTNKLGATFSDEDLEFAEVDGELTRSRHLLWGFELCANQWDAMFYKKYLNTFRKKLLLLVHITLPLYFIVLTMLFTRLEKFHDELPYMTMSLTQYPAVVTILERDRELENMSEDAIEVKIADQYQKIANAMGSAYSFQSTKNSSLSKYILKLGTTMQSQIDREYLAAATIKKGKIIAWLNNGPLHTAPLTLNLVHNAMAKALIKPNAEIIVTNAPLPYKPNEEFERIVNVSSSFGHVLFLVICMSMCIVSALFTVFLIKERACQSKLMQFVSGVQVWSFWLTQFIWDMVIFTITALLAILVIACFREPYISTFAELGRYFLVLIIFGLSMLPLMYLLSFYFMDPATGSACICLINFLGGIITFLISSIFSIFSIKLQYSLNAIFRVYPHFSMVSALNKLYMNAVTHGVCENSALAALSHSEKCAILSQCCELIPYFEHEAPGIYLELVYMILTAVIFFLIILMREYGLFSHYIRLRFGPKRKLPAEDFVNMDDDVWMEKENILDMTKFEKIGENLVIDSVSKFYKNKLAVNHVSLCVKRGECIGLLGIDGAGKTTLIKMMMGDERISHGKALVRGYSIKRHIRKIYTLFGYCPQSDPLFDELTGREHLKIFGLLRGIHKKRIAHVSEGLAKSFGFMKHMDEKTKVYSTGTKRKLSTALAVIGNPILIFLDEPTSGMDPTSRHQVWKFLDHIRDLGMSIVLISHNMQECEALCNRSAIMVNGEIKCMGSSQHLKNKFSKGLILKIKVRVNPDYLRQVTNEQLMYEEQLSFEMSEEKINKAKEFVTHQFPQAILQDDHYGVLTFYIPLKGIKWSQIFGLMENNQKALDIEDYTISQTTLEEIFLEFVKDQGSQTIGDSDDYY